MRVFLADDSTILKRRMARLISGLPGIEIVGEADDPLSAINLVGILKPDAVILDERLQRRFGIDVLQRIRWMTPAPLVVLLTSRMYSSRHGESEGIQADLRLDKFTEWRKLAETLNKFCRNSEKTAVLIPSPLSPE